MTINDSTKTALREAIDKEIPYVAAFIEDGIATTYSSGVTTSTVLEAISHLILQIVVHNLGEEEKPEQYAELLSYAIDYVYDHAMVLLDRMVTFSNTAN
jgi:hypothetical protein